MHRILLIIFCFTVTTSYGQEIELQGRYSAGWLGAEHIDFVGKDSFYFGGFYCTYGVHGKGRCEIKNNYLYLYFEKRAKIIDPLKPPIITKSKNHDAFSVIQLTVVDNNGIPVRNAAINLVSIKFAKFGAIADTLGKAIIKIQNNDFPVILKTSAIGIEPGRVNQS